MTRSSAREWKIVHHSSAIWAPTSKVRLSRGPLPRFVSPGEVYAVVFGAAGEKKSGPSSQPASESVNKLRRTAGPAAAARDRDVMLRLEPVREDHASDRYTGIMVG